MKLPRPRRSKLKIAKDQELTARLYLQGKTLLEIAEATGNNVGVVNKDLTVLKQRWQKSAMEAMDARVSVAAARVSRIYNEAWAAFEESRKQKVSLTQKVRDDGAEQVKESSRKVEEQYGDPLFLELALRCIERTCKIFGVDGPIKLDVTQENKSGVLVVPGIINPEDWEKTARAYIELLDAHKKGQGDDGQPA